MIDWLKATRMTERELTALRAHRCEITRATAAGDEAVLVAASAAAIGCLVRVAALAGASAASVAGSASEQEMKEAIQACLVAAADVYHAPVDFEALGITGRGQSNGAPRRVLN